MELQRIGQALSFRRIGAIYVWVLIIIVFSAISPDEFMSTGTIQAVFNGYSISGLAALAILLPLVTGTYDVSVGGNISVSGVICAALLIHTSLPVAVVVILTLLCGVVVGLVNTLVVVVLRIPSLIGTLAVAGIADALSVAFSGNQILSSPAVAGSFSKYLSQANWGGYTIPVLFVLVIMVVLDWVLKQTAAGRYGYAVGFDPNVARLAGIRVPATQAGSLIVSGVIGSFAGVVLTAHVASATPGSGDAYLLPAFAAVFLGSTQFKARRFNALGTVIAVFMLGTGQYGLVIAGGPTWSPNVFQGVALIAAIGLTHLGDPNRVPLRARRPGRVAPDGSGAAGADGAEPNGAGPGGAGPDGADRGGAGPGGADQGGGPPAGAGDDRLQTGAVAS
ncbi:MAG TPA: ABC transporter permease [Acidimicrobiales bacterium]|nr:ABC transporter permease [Acidimicrobiales bacterium]